MKRRGSPDEEEKSKTFKQTVKNDTKNRLEFLLKQAEIFSHFMTYPNAKNDEKPVGMKRGGKSKR